MLPRVSAFCLRFKARPWPRRWPGAALSCLSTARSGVGSVGLGRGGGTRGVCRSAEGRRAVTAARSVRGAAGRGSEWTERAGVERGPPAHVSTDPPSFGPLNTLTLSGHTERRPPSLLSPPVPRRNGQREGGGQPETLSTSEPGARPWRWDAHLMGSVSIRAGTLIPGMFICTSTEPCGTPRSVRQHKTNTSLKQRHGF